MIARLRALLRGRPPLPVVIALPPKHFERPIARRNLTRAEYDHIMWRASCPYCHGDLYDGPQGGMSTNVLCHTDGCRARFNVVADFGPRNSMFGEVTDVGGHKHPRIVGGP